MGELRFILLLAGLVFLVALAAWELRRPRQAQGDAADAAVRGARRSEPQLGSMSESSPAQLAAAELADARRPVLSRPPRIDLPDLPAMEAMRAESILADADAIQALDAADQPAPPAQAAAANAPEPPPPAVTPAAPPRAPSADFSASISATGSQQIVVDWPPEGERHIIALRIVPAANERLSGRAVRLAITACGFVHGRFGIYHQADGDGRALLSVASLSKPGILDPVNMDFQRLAGINLFTVLPGPLSPGAALDHLVDTARELSQRLPARVQDETGHPLDAERLEDLRERMQSLSAPGLHANPAA
jgi:FtsZ-interacting cell division protein ZipA